MCSQLVFLFYDVCVMLHVLCTRCFVGRYTLFETLLLFILLLAELIAIHCHPQSQCCNRTFYIIYDMVEQLLSVSSSQADAEIDAQDSNGFTALLYAVRQGHQTVVQLLLETGADFSLT